jgi:hypothetical protein
LIHGLPAAASWPMSSSMIMRDSRLVILVKLVDRVPMPPSPAQRGRGRPRVYSDPLF